MAHSNPLPELEQLLARLDEALAVEGDEASFRPVPHRLREGRLIRGDEREGWLYRFTGTASAMVAEGTRGYVEGPAGRAEAMVVAWQDGAISLRLDRPLGDPIRSTQLYCVGWELPDRLREALRAVSGPNFNHELAARVGGVRPLRSQPVPVAPAPDVAAGLDTFQKAAVGAVLGSDLVWLAGPPGSGRTETLARAAQALFRANKTLLLVSANSNSTDELAVRVAARLKGEGNFLARAPMVRMGGFSQAVSPEMWELCDPVPVAARRQRFLLDRAEREEAKQRRKHQLEELVGNELLPPKPGINVEEALRELKELGTAATPAEVARMRELATKTAERLVQGSRIVSCTLAQTLTIPALRRQFDCVLVDDAGQLSRAAGVWLASLARERLVIAGDPRQLPPAALARTEPHRNLLSSDPLEASGTTALLASGLRPPDVMAMGGLRSRRPELAAMAGRLFYPEIPIEPASQEIRPTPLGSAPVLIIDTSGMESGQNAGSRRNPLHARITTELVRKLGAAGYLGTEQRPAYGKVAVVAPYRDQVVEVERRLDAAGSPVGAVSTLSCHRMLGSPRELVILDLCDGVEGRAPSGFLRGERPTDEGTRVIAAAAARAGQQLVIIADLSHLESQLPQTCAVRRMFDWGRVHGKVVPGEQVLEVGERALGAGL